MNSQPLQNSKTPPLFELHEISKDYPQPNGKKIRVLEKIDFSMRRKELVTLLGPSGCGKSTLLRILCGLIPPSEGEVYSHGKLLTGLNPHVGLVFQSFALYPWLTVGENVEIGLEAKTLTPSERREKVNRVLSQVGLNGFEDAYPKELSGGMKKRVGIARALVMEPDLLCMDEPFSGLDVLTAENLRNEIVDLWLKPETRTDTILIVTNNITEAIFLSTRIVIFGSNPGQIRAVVQNPIPFPRDPRSKDFLNLADRIYDLIANALIPDEGAPETLPRFERKKGLPKMEPLPNVDADEIVGLVEAIHARKGEIDLFDFADEVDQEFGRLVLIAKAAEMLGLVETPKHQVRLTETGRKFSTAPHTDQQAIFKNQLTELNIFDFILKMLNTAETHALDSELIEEELAIRLPNENPINLFETLLNWGRYAGLLDSDPRTNKLILEKRPSEPEPLGSPQ